MPFEIIRGDITEIKADAIVNTANPDPVIGSGVDAGIHKKAGAKLIKVQKKIGPIAVGQAAITPAFDLDAKYVIHAVGPVWEDGEHGETALLRQCYDSALTLAAKKRCKSVAFPLFSAGNYGFPKAVSLQVAVSAFSAFLMDHEMRILLVVFERDAFVLSEKLFQSVRSYIDEHYIQEKLQEEYAAADSSELYRALRDRRQDRGMEFTMPQMPSPGLLKTILRVMKKYELLSEIRRRRKWRQMGQQVHKYEILLNRQFYADGPNSKWVTDISYIHTKEGVLYLSMIRDLYDNSIVAYKTGTQQTVNLVLDTIRLAIKKEKMRAAAELQLHSDQGFQYTSQAYFELTQEYGITLSMSRRGNCYDNAMAENFFSILKTECIYRHKPVSLDETKERIDRYIHFYNHQRIQQKTGVAPLMKRHSA